MTNTQGNYCIVKDTIWPLVTGAGKIVKQGAVGAYNILETAAPNLGKQVVMGVSATALLLGAYNLKCSSEDNPSESNTRHLFTSAQESIESNVEDNGIPWGPIGAGAGTAALGIGALALINRRRRNAVAVQPEISDAVEINPTNYSRNE
ncbi:hypothetical protein HOF78_00455 [Candidatus Woesearchaeota archaeon]|jgi:hypothetical protein|nr:hypothetical protein [Candidatus Woesearchaeota archaeon]MBT6044563.1 hypothetical protein [Candidatus Woesearchaeota archaeon]